MASIKVKYRPSATNGKEGSIYYQVIHKRTVRQIGTDFRVFEYVVRIHRKLFNLLISDLKYAIPFHGKNMMLILPFHL